MLEHRVLSSRYRPPDRRSAAAAARFLPRPPVPPGHRAPPCRASPVSRPVRPVRCAAGAT